MSERKQAEEITGLLAAIVASSDDAIVSKNLDGIITSWNKSAERIFGYTPDEAIGQHITLIIPPERHSEESDILGRIRLGERVDHFQTVRRAKDGSLLDVSLTISPVRDSSGRVIGASKVARDITAQKQVERALRESEQRFRVITDASPVMVWMAGTDKLCYYFNKGWLDFVGRTLEQESGNGWAENVHPEDFDRCLQIYVANFDARRPFEMEYRMRHHTGQYRWILDRGVPRYAPDGTFEGYVGGCLDIHDQKEAAEKVRIADDMTRLMKAQDEERRRIARELHDSAGQTLAVLGMSLAQLVRRAEGIAPELAREGKAIEAMVQQLHREIRTTSYLLHPPLLDESGLASALNFVRRGAGRTQSRSHHAGCCRQCWKTAKRYGACNLSTGAGMPNKYPPALRQQDRSYPSSSRRRKCPNRGAGSRKGHIARALVGNSVPRRRRRDQGNPRAYPSIPRRNENRIEWFRHLCDCKHPGAQGSPFSG